MLNKLLKIKLFHADLVEQEEWCMKVNKFFEDEISFFCNKIDKYDRLLGTDPVKHGPQQLELNLSGVSY